MSLQPPELRFVRFALLLAIVALFSAGSARAATNSLYVATNGNDGWSGTLAQPNGTLTDGPKASLQGAQLAVRAILAQGGYQWPTVVQIAGGTYALTNAATFGLADSAGATNPVVYQAAPGAQPVFSGGRMITGWTPGTNGLWTASVPWATGSNYFEQLWIDGQWAMRAILPTNDYYYIQATNSALPYQAFYGSAANLAPLASLSPAEFSNATVIAYHNWTTSRLRLSAFNASSNLLTFTSPARYAFITGNRYQIENIPSALVQAGQWFLAPNGTLTYWPLPGQDMTTAQVVAPQTGSFIAVTGNSTNLWFVQNLTFSGLSFQYGLYVLPAIGDSEAQAEPNLPAVITLNGARNVLFTNCEVAHLGQHAIHFVQGCQNCVVSHCYLHDLGGGGVYIGETNQESNVNNYTITNTVDNCIIRAGGRIYACSAGVWIGNSSSNSVTHNEIADFFETCVSAGWTWGYGTSIANHNHINWNHIHDLGWGVMSDMGAIYTLGISPGTTEIGNYVYNVTRYVYGYGGWGLYNDEGSSGILLASNLVYATQDGCYFLNYGQTNTLQNNIFADSINAQLDRNIAETNRFALTFQNNIVYWPYLPYDSYYSMLLGGSWSDTNFLMRSNLYWQVSFTNISFVTNTFAQWQARGQDLGSSIADPLFMDGLNRDFRLAGTAWAAAVGFQPFSFTNAGVYGDPAWRALAELPSQPAWLPDPPPSLVPFNYNDNFESDLVGQPPINAEISGTNGAASILVVTNNPADGLRCLAVTGAAGLAKSFYPYFQYSPPDLTGSLNYGFYLRLAAGTQMSHEWRDYNFTGSSYVEGPSVQFVLGQLEVGGSVLTTVQSNEWLRVQITCNTSNYVTQGWRLGLTQPGQATQWWTNYPSGSGTNWSCLNQLYWFDNSTNNTTFYLDDLTMTNLPSYMTTNPQPPAPVITGLTNCTAAANSVIGPQAFTVVDPAVPASALTLTVSATNPRLLPAAGLVLGGAGANRTLTVTPAAGQSGLGAVSVTADDGTFNSTVSFQVTVLSQPALTVLPAGANLLLTWPPGGSGFSVWQSTNLALPSSWTPVSGTPVLSGGLWQQSVPASGSAIFYRLQSSGTP